MPPLLSLIPASVRASACARLLASFRPQSLRLRPEDLATLKLSFSQFGEDLVVAEHLMNRRSPARGIYIDAGCFDPFRYSNTRLLHLMGWRGLNVDASPEVIERFRRCRPGDVSVCAALAETAAPNEFLEVGSGAASRLGAGALPVAPSAVQSRRTVFTRTLEEVFQASGLAGEPVDFLDIDCEGADLGILKSFDLRAHPPAVLCVEAHSSQEEAALRDHLSGFQCELVCRRGPSLIFRSRALA